MSALLSRWITCFLLVAVAGRLAAQDPKPDENNLEDLINRCLEGGGLRPLKDPRTGKVIRDAKLGIPHLVVADAPRLRAAVSANKQLLNVRVRNGLAGLAQLAEPASRATWIYLLRVVGEVTADDLALEVAATVAAQLGLPRPSPDGMEALKDLVRHAVEGEAIEVVGEGRRLALRDGAKLRAIVARNRALVTPALLDTAVATSYRIDHSILLQAIGEELKDERALACAAYFTGKARQREGKWPAAIAQFTDAARRFGSLKDAPWKAQALSGLAGGYRALHEYDAALENYTEALSILKKVHQGKHRDVALLLFSIAGVHVARSEYQRALFYHVQALPILEGQGDMDPLDLAIFTHQLGFICRHTGEPAEALEHYEAALTVFRKVVDDGRALEATCLKNMGYAHLDLKDLARAQKCFAEALDLRLKHFGPNHPDVGHSRLDQALGLARNGKLAEALQSLEMAEGIFRKHYGPHHPLIASTLHHQGHVCLLQKDLAGALSRFDQALRVLTLEGKGEAVAGFTAADYRPSVEVVQVLNHRGQILSQLADGDPVNALVRLQASRHAFRVAADVLEAVRGTIPGEDDRVRAGEDVFAVFPAWIGVCRQLHARANQRAYLEEAWTVAERSTARVFLQALGEPVARSLGGVDEKLRQEELLTLARMQRVEDQFARVLGLPEDQRDPERARQLWEERRQLDGALSRLREKLARDFPQYAACRYPRPCALAEARACLSANEVALQFILERTQSWLVLVEAQPAREDPSGGLAAIPLPAAEVLSELVASLTDTETLAQATRTRAVGAEVYQALLGPLRERLRNKDLVIVPGGPLAYLPFELLVEDGRFLIENHRVRYAPSLTALHLIRQAEPKRVSPDLPLWAIGDPVYAADDARLRGPAKETAAALQRRQDLGRLEGRAGALTFPRLESSAAEVTAVARLLGAKRESVRLGLEAQEAAVKAASAAGALARARYVHFATHGILGQEAGRLQPGLVLSLVETGSEDGFLDLNEVTTLRLNADLVVLSACRTGQGRLYSSEGVQGLARSFLYAGSRGVICSLWAVADKETASLMTTVYGHLEKGQRAADALRTTKRAMIKDGKPPLFWAPFILIGE